MRNIRTLFENLDYLERTLSKFKKTTEAKITKLENEVKKHNYLFYLNSKKQFYKGEDNEKTTYILESFYQKAKR